MSKEQQTDGESAKHQEEEEEEEGEVIGAIIGAVVALGVLYIVGWTVIWGQSIPTADSVILESDGFLVRFNNLFYGLAITDRFFYSPVIAWVALAGCASAATSRFWLFGAVN